MVRFTKMEMNYKETLEKNSEKIVAFKSMFWIC